MDYLFLLLGLLVLLGSGELLVKGGVSLARHFHISTLVVGMTVVSMGTSAPELMVSLKAVISGKADFSTGTVVGSNISNVALVLGLTALILPIPVNRRSTFFDWPVMFGATLLFFFFIRNGRLETLEGILFVALLVVYVVYSILQSRNENKKSKPEFLKPNYTLPISILIIVVSAVGLRFGAEWLVRGASGVASAFGVSDYIISVTVVAFGTSVPELATSVIAAIRKETDISIGNILGSNLFNILGILGVTAAIKPVEVNAQIVHFDIYWLGALSVLLFLMMLPFTAGKISRLEGGILVTTYLAYLYLLFSDTL